ncbi:hypothetical protein A11A3_10341 [Alcanivorax hongdengensis A-11-3]|uniref:Uncharacterized protein n=1 Tax=Alcanivorax hongdengensis A-11-3 TaxID=1177179 RepID=L0WE18_9GAMM|nr:hypothetical protein [Alcanivorax hongdengensis]EKF74050.1 hypothetical protein A11A3_10341 [Alcanivorax hongdengensis A-11-3]
MSNPAARFWSVQLQRIQEQTAAAPLFSPDKASLLFRAGRQRLRHSVETLVCVGPLHGASDDELFQLADIATELCHAIGVELSIRGAGRLSLLRFDTQDQTRSVLLSTVAINR